MGRTARSEVFDPAEVSVFHCINRCVRRCFLCGIDPLTGADHEHRKAWIEARLEFLAGCYGIDVLSFAVLENHFHVILRNRPDVVAEWSDQEVARRWLMLCPVRKQADGSPEEPNAAELASITGHPDRLREIRSRLSHISWFMRMVSEPVARRANAEEQVTGRFWQGRFRAVKLCDEAAMLACSVYVDLNPIRAGICQTPETSQHTSAALRIQQRQQPGSSVSAWLAPLELNERQAPGTHRSQAKQRCSDKGFLPLDLDDYLMLLDWTGRQVVRGKPGRVPVELTPILQRLGIEGQHWYRLATRFGQLFYLFAGNRASLTYEATRRHRRWYQAPGGQLISTIAA